MSAKRISQREARRLRKRVAELEDAEDQRGRRWASEWPGGVHLHTISGLEKTYSAVDVARRLGHACVVLNGDGGTLMIYACKVK